MRKTGISPFGAGLLTIVIVVVVFYFAFSQTNPFDKPYHVTAYFRNANNIQPNSVVRIAGVEVGKVKSVSPADPKTHAAKVELELQDKGLPIHKDAQVKVRPRIFLEGNMFIDIQPGTPESPTLESGDSIPVSQTASPVQFEEVLRTLQRDTRSDLQTLLKEFAKGLKGGGAEAFNRSIKYWKPAYQYASLANDASLGQQPHDLSKVVRAQADVAGSLTRNQQALGDLVTNLNTTFAAFASKDAALRASIPALDRVLKVGSPALKSLNDTLPSMRRFARAALPAAKSSLPTIEQSMPFVRQARLLVRPSELRGLVKDLRPTIPALAKLNANLTPFLDQSRALSACTSNLLVPFAKKPIPDPVFNIPNSSFLHDSNHGFVGLAGESRINDANTPMFHVQQGAGPFSVVQTSADLGKMVSLGGMYFKPEGTMPAKPDHRPVFRPGIPCETQEVADLAAPRGAAETLANPDPVSSVLNTDRLKTATDLLGNITQGVQSGDLGAVTGAATGATGATTSNLLSQFNNDLFAQFNENLSRIGRQAADSVLNQPMAAAAARQYGDKAQVAPALRRKYGP